VFYNSYPTPAILGVKTSPLHFHDRALRGKVAKQSVKVNLYKGPGTVLGRSLDPKTVRAALSVIPFRCNIKRMKLLVIDDHPVLRGGLSALLLQIEKDVVVLQAADAQEGLALVAQHADLDIVILDIVMPGIDGFQAIAEFGRVRPELPVVVLSSSESPKDARQALTLGALGYVPKSASQHTLLAAVRLVMNGDLYLPPLLLGDTETARQTNFPAREGMGKPVLTERQVAVLRLVGEGRSNKAISFELGLSEKTIKSHITAIFKILNVVNRTHAVTAGRENGLI
jgi:two-component system nitrate/nitrite response regulator NarL